MAQNALVSQTLKKTITSFELWCYRRILKIKWTDMVPNTEVLSVMKLGTPVLLKQIMCRQSQFLVMWPEDQLEKN